MVAHNVRVGFLGKKRSSAERGARVGEALERFNVDHLAEHRAATLAGGEMRRLALARAFALRPAVLLLDEPFAGLDADGQAALSLDLRRAISDTGVAVAMVTHDLRRAMLLADRIAVLIDGTLAQVGSRDAVLEQPSTIEIARVVGMTISRARGGWVSGVARAPPSPRPGTRVSRRRPGPGGWPGTGGVWGWAETSGPRFRGIRGGGGAADKGRASH